MAWSAVCATAAGANPIGLKRGIDAAVARISEELANLSKEVETKEQIASTASISAGDPQIGEYIAEAMDKVGKEGVITVEEGQTFGLELELAEGMRFDKGYISPYFATDLERMETVLEDPTSSSPTRRSPTTSSFRSLRRFCRPAACWSSSPRTSRAPRCRPWWSIRSGTFKSVAIKAPAGDRRKAMLQDIAILTGGQVITEEAFCWRTPS